MNCGARCPQERLIAVSDDFFQNPVVDAVDLIGVAVDVCGCESGEENLRRLPCAEVRDVFRNAHRIFFENIHDGADIARIGVKKRVFSESGGAQHPFEVGEGHEAVERFAGDFEEPAGESSRRGLRGIRAVNLIGVVIVQIKNVLVSVPGDIVCELNSAFRLGVADGVEFIFESVSENQQCCSAGSPTGVRERRSWG